MIRRFKHTRWAAIWGRCSLVLRLALVWWAAPLDAQQGATGQDPLLTLMMSQPSILLLDNVKITAEFDPPTVNVGELAVYRVSLIALQDSVEWPEEIPAPPQLNLRPGAQGNILTPLGTNIEPRTTFVFRARPSEPGQFTIPEFSVPVYGKTARVPAARLQVLPPGVPHAGSAQTLRMELSTTNAYVGQAVRVKVLLPFSAPTSQSLSGVQLTGAEGQGFLVDQSSVRQRIEPVPTGGSNQITYIYETLITPIAPGRMSFYAHGWTTINRATGPVYITNNMVMNLITTYTLLDSDPVELQVKGLPSKGQLPGFAGAVGFFTNDPPVLSTNVVRAGDPIKMRVTFRGNGNIARLVPPPAPRTDDWQIFEASGDPTAPQMIHAQGAITFTYTLIPLTPDIRQTPELPYSSFDPLTQRYIDLTVRPVPIKVIPSETAIDSGALAQANAASGPRETQLTLSGMAVAPGFGASSLLPIQSRPWFILVQVAPALLFLILFVWDKRRRYLAAHPDVVLRARGLRELRRRRKAMNHAWERRDAATFSLEAIEALRAGSSPHYPALPRALVGSDVLQVLAPEVRHGAAGAAVRELFLISDASNYADHPSGGDNLLSRRAELIDAMNALERTLQPREPVWSFLARPRTSMAQAVAILGISAGTSFGASSQTEWQQGTNAFAAQQFEEAARHFQNVAATEPSPGSMVNLGLAEWHLGNVGPAILAWEQAVWLNPFTRQAAQNLAFARHSAQLVGPELAWFEVPSRWLPPNWWPWLTGAGLWLAVGAILLPGILGERRAAWQQGVAALGFTLFLICIPAQIGVQTRAKLGIVLQKDTPLRLTPTSQAQTILHLAAGEPARVRRTRGQFLYVKTAGSAGWILKSEVGLIADPAGIQPRKAMSPPASVALTSQ